MEKDHLVRGEQRAERVRDKYRLHTEVLVAAVALCHVNNKATYTEVCNLLVPWQQETTRLYIHVFYKQHVKNC